MNKLRYTLLPGGSFAIIHIGGVDTVVDVRDLSVLLRYPWHTKTTPTGIYVVSKIGRTNISMANLVAGGRADHINRDSLDNRRCNLRLATRSQNQANRVTALGAYSRYKGVGPHGAGWRGKITKDYKQFVSPVLATQEEAALWYNNKAKELFGDFAILNDILQ